MTADGREAWTIERGSTLLLVRGIDETTATHAEVLSVYAEAAREWDARQIGSAR